MPPVLSVVVVTLLFGATAHADAAEPCEMPDEHELLDDGATAASSGACAVSALARVVTKSTSMVERRKALAQLGYVGRFDAHFDAVAHLRRFIETSRVPEIRTAALSALRSTSLGMTSKETDLTRFATHKDAAVRAALADVLTRECDTNDRALVDAALAHETDPALKEKWRAASHAVATCTQPARAAVLAVLRKERTLQSLACDEAKLVVNDQFVVVNGSADRRNPRVSARRTGAPAVAATVELDTLLAQVSDTALHCKANECVHLGRVNDSEFAFWFSPSLAGKSGVCLDRIVRTRHEIEPQLH